MNMTSPSLPFDLDGRKKFLRHLSETLSRVDVEARLTAMADAVGHDRFRKQAADDIVAILRPADVLPRVYGGYRQVVTDGIRFILSRLPVERISRLMADQALLSPETPAGARLLMLARHLPTLHKLGQIIARNRHLDPSLKNWLVALEHAPCTVPMDDIIERIRAALGEDIARYDIRIGSAPIAEASVGLAVPFTFARTDGTRRRGVFKMLRPGVESCLREELDLLPELAGYLDARRHRYPLKHLHFADVFQDIRSALMEEADLSGEQKKLKAAFRFYHDRGPARVPTLYPFSTPEITAMAFLGGERITEACTTPEDRRRLAEDLFRILIWRPLFSPDPRPPFHGDPHAGNLLAQCRDITGSFRLGLIDWSLSGTLPRDKRSRLIFTMLGILMAARDRISQGIQDLSVDDDRYTPAFRSRLDRAIDTITADNRYLTGGIAGKTFVLLDGLALEGFRFPSDLLLFRKAFFTLEGVLFDLCPAFDLDKAMAGEMALLMMTEGPQRWAAWSFPFMDRPENYRSLISNLDLRILAQHLMTLFFQQGTAMMTGLWTAAGD